MHASSEDCQPHYPLIPTWSILRKPNCVYGLFDERKNDRPNLSGHFFESYLFENELAVKPCVSETLELHPVEAELRIQPRSTIVGQPVAEEAAQHLLIGSRLRA